jgi:hypothetical protein
MKFLVHDGTVISPYETRTEVMTLRGDGNVGIGTNNPGAPLHIGDYTTGSAGEILRMSGASSADRHFKFLNEDDASVGGASSNAVWVHDINSAFGQYAFRTNGGDLMRITNNGYVGIGTTSPDASLHVSGTGAIVVPSGTTEQQPTGVTGMIRFNTAVGKLEFYNGTVWSLIGGVNATGGAVTNVGGYAIHTFTSSDTFTVNLGGEVEYLVVAGGGAGGTDRGGGGGAGGMLTGTVSISPGSYTITRGGGAAPVTEYGTSSGSASSIGSLITAAGGGGGGGEGGAGATGGSGGGSGYGSGGYGSGTSGQGNRGGSGYSGVGYRTAGGGGGAGTVGVNGSSNGTNGGVQRPDGGAGIASSISGSGLYYSGGGGGGRCDVDSAGANTGGSGVGGSNVGGNGTATTNGNGSNGTAGRGGGGGGGGATSTTGVTGGLGGSGIVIIRYLS